MRKRRLAVFGRLNGPCGEWLECGHDLNLPPHLIQQFRRLGTDFLGGLFVARRAFDIRQRHHQLTDGETLGKAVSVPVCRGSADDLAIYVNLGRRDSFILPAPSRRCGWNARRFLV